MKTLTIATATSSQMAERNSFKEQRRNERNFRN
jgi:hypothetical protein